MGFGRTGEAPNIAEVAPLTAAKSVKPGMSALPSRLRGRIGRTGVRGGTPGAAQPWKSGPAARALRESVRHVRPGCFSPRARALTTSIVTFGARRPHWREVVLSSSCASERVRRSSQCGCSRDCQSPLQWRRVLPCLVKLPEQGVCVGLLLPPLDAAHAEMQQLGGLWGCWMWYARRLAV